MKSQARQFAESLKVKDGDNFPYLGIPAPSSVTGGYEETSRMIGYFNDKSILIWTKREGYLILDEAKTYYRDTVEHLARCLSLFSRERRADMIGHEEKWVDGLKWGANGEYLAM